MAATLSDALSAQNVYAADYLGTMKHAADNNFHFVKISESKNAFIVQYF